MFVQPGLRAAMRHSAWALVALTGACGGEGTAAGPDPSEADAGSTPPAQGSVEGVTEASEVDWEAVRADAQAQVFVPPYQTCVAPREGEPAGQGPDGTVCTQVSIAGATEPDRAFADYASCAVVRTQRPFWEAPPANEPSADDPRLDDDAFVTELAWVTSQVRATGCVCCHDSQAVDGKFGQWDISRGPIWTDTVSDDGVALFTGLASSAVLGAYPPEDNNGFSRDTTGLPSTDPARMRQFFLDELARRGISEDEARAVPPFGGPIYQNQIKPPRACPSDIGVKSDGTMQWGAQAARYVYVLAEGSRNPGVPPNLDKPEGTLWRLDVLPSANPLRSGIAYGETPRGTFQMLPEAEAAPALREGVSYQLFVELDMGFVVENCLFTYPAQ
jgi:hypothetical protein